MRGLAGPAVLHRDLAWVERRHDQLWILALTVTAVLAVALVAMLAWIPDTAYVARRRLLDGLLVLVTLLIAYLVQRHRELRRLRNWFIREQVGLEALEFKLRELTSIFEVSSRVNAPGRPEDLFPFLARKVTEALGADGAALFLLSGRGGRLTMGACAGDGEGEGPGAAALALARRAPVRLPGGEEGPDRGDEPPTRAVLAVPLVLRGRTLGALKVYRVDPSGQRPFSEVDEGLTAIFAESAAAIIQSARLHERLRSRNRKLRDSLHYLKKAQRQLILAEKLQAMEEFVSGVAHELNNPLTSISGFTQLLLTPPRPAGGEALAPPLDRHPDLERYLKNIADEAVRCQEIVRSLQRFTRQYKFEKRNCAPRDLVEAALGVKSYTLKKLGIVVERSMPSELPELHVDPDLMQHVLISLIRHAAGALKRSAEPRLLRVAASYGAGAFQFEVAHNAAEPDLEEAKRLFTREGAAHDSPSSLTVAYNIVRAHGGEIRVAAGARGPASLVIELPMKSAGGTQRGEGGEAPPPGGGGQGRRVLVVDDEERVLNLLERVLGNEGYAVDTARSAAEAVEKISDGNFDAFIVDHQMPGGGGEAVFDYLRERKPGYQARLIYTSGDTGTEEFCAALRRSRALYIPKPFRIRQALAVLSDVLERPLSGNGSRN
jgi:signal transduction histidine kinase